MRHGFDDSFEQGFDIVDDPYEPGAKLTVAKNIRHDVLSWLKDHHQIDHAQYVAGQRFRGLMERAGVTGARAVDLTKPYVDYRPDPTLAILTAAQALDQLTKARLHLGWRDYELVYQVLSSPAPIGGIGFVREKERRYMARRFRDALEMLAKFWGMAG